jgi:hypothetical protein
MADDVARPRSYGDLPAALSGAVVSAVVLIGQSGWARLGLALACLACAGWAAAVIAMRLHFSPSKIAVTVGPWTRTVSLTELSDVGYKRTGYTAVITLKDRSGGRLSINVRRFKRDNEWSRLILDASIRAGVVLPKGAQASLEHADGESGGWVE